MLLNVKGLNKSYDVGGVPIPVLRDVNFELAAGEAAALVGESGSGKSTVLHLIAGLDRPAGGRITLGDAQVQTLSDAQSAQMRRTQVGVIFQQFNLIPSLTVRANITFHARLGDRLDAAWADHLAEKIGLADHLEKYPEALSGGQQQRVAIARTLAARPVLILADEPTGNLDEDTSDRVLALMLESAHETNAAVLMVTHSQRLAGRMSRKLLLSHGVVTQVPDRARAE